MLPKIFKHFAHLLAGNFLLDISVIHGSVQLPRDVGDVFQVHLSADDAEQGVELELAPVAQAFRKGWHLEDEEQVS